MGNKCKQYAFLELKHSFPKIKKSSNFLKQKNYSNSNDYLNSIFLNIKSNINIQINDKNSVSECVIKFTDFTKIMNKKPNTKFMLLKQQLTIIV